MDLFEFWDAGALLHEKDTGDQGSGIQGKKFIVSFPYIHSIWISKQHSVTDNPGIILVARTPCLLVSEI